MQINILFILICVLKRHVESENWHNRHIYIYIYSQSHRDENEHEDKTGMWFWMALPAVKPDSLNSPATVHDAQNYKLHCGAYYISKLKMS